MKALVAGLALALAPVPVLAQDSEGGAEEDISGGMFESGGDWLGGLMAAFTPEPLTAEQEARLPAASAVIDQMMPPGTAAEVVGAMLEGFARPIAQEAQVEPIQMLATTLGMARWELAGMTDEQVGAALSLLDPAWQQRARREAEMGPAMSARVMAAFEPGLRRTMAELYAIYFTDAELVAIGAFFATPAGASYARKSTQISSDPRLAASMMQQIPAMMETMAALEAEAEASMADLPPARTFAELSANERKALARLVGMEVEELERMSGASDSDDPGADAGARESAKPRHDW